MSYNIKIDGVPVPVAGTPPIATTEQAGVVKPDGETITIDSDGTIHSAGGGNAYEWYGTDDELEEVFDSLKDGTGFDTYGASDIYEYDDHLDAESECAVQNKVITSALSDKLNYEVLTESEEESFTSDDDTILIVSDADEDIPTDEYDDHLDTTSINAVQNKVVANKLNQLNTDFTESSTIDTTERIIGKWNGKTLYQKLVVYTNSSTIGNASSVTDIQISHGVSGLTQVVGIDACMSTGQVLPYLNNGTETLVVSVNNSLITLRITKDAWSSRTWYFTLRYIK